MLFKTKAMNTKKLATLILTILLIFQSCSSDDNDIADNEQQNYFLSVEFAGESFFKERPDIDFLFPIDNCLSAADYSWLSEEDQALITPSQWELMQGDALISNVGQIETSEYFIDMHMAYHEIENGHLALLDAIDSTGNGSWEGDAILQQNEGFGSLDCISPFTFLIDFVIGNEELTLVFDSEDITVSRPILVGGIPNEAEYSISGVFSADFIDINDNVITLNGEFKMPMYMLN